MLLETLSTTSYDLSMIGMLGETHIKEVGRVQSLVRRDQSEGLLRFDIVRYPFRSDKSNYCAEGMASRSWHLRPRQRWYLATSRSSDLECC